MERRMAGTLETPRIRVVDFFSGCGGTSSGLRDAGLEIAVGIDCDTDAAKTYALNFPEARFINKDIRKLRTSALGTDLWAEGTELLFSACAPCQPFSKQRRGTAPEDDRVPLLIELIRFVRYYEPEYIFVENVPGLQTLKYEHGPFAMFVAKLTALGYDLEHRVIDSCDYGVPQRRRRLVIIGSSVGPLKFPRPTHGPSSRRGTYSSVWDWIGDLPPLQAGQEDPTVPNHRASALSPTNLRRIQATLEGGGRENWPESLLLACHKDDYDGHTDVYGRMQRHALASALTTRCISLSNGRFGHPVQDRAISVREAACLQTFSRSFQFDGSMTSMARQIGNAVPVLISHRFGKMFLTHARRRAALAYHA
jgi:DNA (cytosine-5)-methyltransferase 1